MKVLLPIAENLIADPRTTLQPKIDRYAAPIVARRHTIEQVTIPLALTVPQVAAIIRARLPDGGAVELFGAIPPPQVYQGVDGHAYRPGDEDLGYGVPDLSIYTPLADGSYQLPWPVPQNKVVGRIDFSGLAGTDYYGDNLGGELALTSAWLDWHHAVTTGQASFDNKSVMVDILDYMMPTLGSRLIADLESVTGQGSVLDTRNAFPFKQFFQTYSGRTFLAAALYDGGEPFIVGEYNTGSLADFASGLVKMCLMVIFCSYGWQTEKWPLQRAALVGGSLAVVYGTWSPPALGRWSETVSIGEALYDSVLDADNDDALFTIIGDVMLVKPVSTGDDDMSQSDLLALQLDYNAFKAAVIAAVPALQSVVALPPPGTNYCAASNGGAATASSIYSPAFNANQAINGDRRGLNWENGGGWNCNEVPSPTEWILVEFKNPQTINRIVVFGLQDNYNSPVEPTDDMKFTQFGPVDFFVEVEVNGMWLPAGTPVANNSNVIRPVSFPEIANVAAIRISITKTLDNSRRLVEVEAYGP